jgi:acyl carrier protein
MVRSTAEHWKGNEGMEEKILEILRQIHPDAPVAGEGLVDNGILDSLDIVTLVTMLNAAFDVRIPAVEILPDNFNSVAAMAEMIERLDDV